MTDGGPGNPAPPVGDALGGDEEKPGKAEECEEQLDKEAEQWRTNKDNLNTEAPTYTWCRVIHHMEALQSLHRPWSMPLASLQGHKMAATFH